VALGLRKSFMICHQVAALSGHTGDELGSEQVEAADGSEFSGHIRDHHVLDLESGRGVNRIDVPGADTYFGPNFGANCGVHFLSSPVL
jgi:hypothetical protein